MKWNFIIRFRQFLVFLKWNFISERNNDVMGCVITKKMPLSNDRTCPWRKRSTKNGLPLYVSTCDDIDDIFAFWTWRRADFQKWHHSFWLPDTCYGIMLMKCKVSIYTLKWLFLNERPFECINGWSPQFGEASFIRWNGDFENKYHFEQWMGILQIVEKCHLNVQMTILEIIFISTYK